MKLDILAIGVHPDDIELCASGTLIRHIEQGRSVGLCDLTQGELGSRGNGPLRLKEAERAKDIIGATVRVNLGMMDGFFQHTPENIIKIARVIRTYRPDIVLANAIHDRHPDHGRAAKLISDACFYSGLVKIEIDNLDHWRPKAVYHYIQDRNIKPDFVVDITAQMDKKMESVLAYTSQFYDPDSIEVDTPISGQDFLKYVKAKNRNLGRSIGVDYAEGFTVERTPGVADLFDLL